MRNLKERFIQGVTKMEHVSVHGLADETSAPHIVSVGIAGVRSEVLLHTLEEKGITFLPDRPAPPTIRL